MRIQWTLAVVLASALAVGCSDQSAENTENPVSTGDQAAPGDQPAASEGTRLAPSTDGDDSAVRDRVTPAPGRPIQPSRPAAVTPPASSAPRASTPAAAPRQEWRELTLAAGTALPLELVGAISSETAQVETPVRARLRQAVSVDGRSVLPAGAILHGNVTDVARAGRVQGRSRLAFRFTEVEIDGTREELRTNVLAFEGEQTKGEDATKVGAGAVGGAIIGGILGGGDGAAKGAIIGGAAGTGAVLATRGREVELAGGTSLAASLAQPLTLRVRE